MISRNDAYCKTQTNKYVKQAPSSVAFASVKIVLLPPAVAAVPIAIHGDGVPIVGLGKGWSRVMTLSSWYSLVGQGATRELLFWVWGMYDRLCTGGVADGTRGKFLAVLKWSLMTMMEGL